MLSILTHSRPFLSDLLANDVISHSAMSSREYCSLASEWFSESTKKNLAKLVHKLHYLQVFTICIAVCVCQIYHSPYLKPNLQYAACFKPQSIFQSQNLYVFFLNMLELDP